MELSPAGRWADLPEDIALAVASRLQVGALSLSLAPWKGSLADSLRWLQLRAGGRCVRARRLLALLARSLRRRLHLGAPLPLPLASRLGGGVCVGVPCAGTQKRGKVKCLW